MNMRSKLEALIRRIVFVEFSNHAFSQMAECYCKSIICKEYVVSSGGFMPTPAIHPYIYKVMDEAGYSLLGQYPKMVPHEWWDHAYRIILLGTGEERIPFMPDAEDILLWKVARIENLTLDELRRERDILFNKVKKFVEMLPCECRVSTKSS